MARAVAQRIVAEADSAVRLRGVFRISLAGGNTPRLLYSLLATEYSNAMPWQNTHIFFNDERCVPPSDKDSNYAMANGAMLSVAPVNPRGVFRIRGELPPDEGAADYERTLVTELGAGLAERPVDVALLGMGHDGHTASLFPGGPELQERSRLVVPVHAPDYMNPRDRVSLTIPALCAARRVWFLVTGADKRDVAEKILSGAEGASEKYPAAQIRGRDETHWFLDRTVAPGK